MAVVRAYTQFNLTGATDPNGVLEIANATTIRTTDGDGFVWSYGGSFTYDAFGEVYGRLDEISATFAGQSVLAVSALNADAHTFYELVGSGDSQELYGYLLSGDDRIFASRASDILIGYNGNDRIGGSGGNDYLLGQQGLDRLYGGNGSDYLNGGTAGDLMAGGMGNDRYYSDNANDRIVEAANEGIDTIFASASRGMAADIENLTLTGLGVWAVGNGLANSIRGNDINNALRGGAGDDWIFGGSGDDRITGGQGIDHLIGDGGFDTFVFSDATGQDVVDAFELGIDLLNLAAIDADEFSLGDQAFAYIGSAAFSGTIAGELRYDGTTLSGDVNGDGEADFGIEIANHVELAATDILL